MHRKRALVTAGAGSIGSHVTDLLQRESRAQSGSCLDEVIQILWQRGHQAVVRPPIVSLRKDDRWRGHTPLRFHF